MKLAFREAVLDEIDGTSNCRGRYYSLGGEVSRACIELSRKMTTSWINCPLDYRSIDRQLSELIVLLLGEG